MPNLGDINVQSIAGAINTATHGTGLDWGNIATAIVGLLVTGGSDYHGPGFPNPELGSTDVPDEVLPALLAAAGR